MSALSAIGDDHLITLKPRKLDEHERRATKPVVKDRTLPTCMFIHIPRRCRLAFGVQDSLIQAKLIVYDRGGNKHDNRLAL
jgi:hypothetical protein